METINPVKKKVLVKDDEVQGDHVVVHQLSTSEKLVQVVGQYRQQRHTKAVVVANTSDSLILEKGFLEGFEGVNYPVVIVSRADGQEILEAVEQEEDDVFCDIEVETTVDAPTHLLREQGLAQAITEQPRPGATKPPNPQENKSSGTKFKSLYLRVATKSASVQKVYIF